MSSRMIKILRSLRWLFARWEWRRRCCLILTDHPSAWRTPRKRLLRRWLKPLKNHWNMAVAVVDPTGTLVYYEKMDNTQIGSANVSINKARSAALYKRPTKAFQDALAGGGAGLRVMALEGAVPVEGGIPISPTARSSARLAFPAPTAIRMANAPRRGPTRYQVSIRIFDLRASGLRRSWAVFYKLEPLPLRRYGVKVFPAASVSISRKGFFAFPLAAELWHHGSSPGKDLSMKYRALIVSMFLLASLGPIYGQKESSRPVPVELKVPISRWSTRKGSTCA